MYSRSEEILEKRQWIKKRTLPKRRMDYEIQKTPIDTMKLSHIFNQPGIRSMLIAHTMC